MTIDAAAVRRVAITLAFYGVLAWATLIGAGWVRRLLALPPMFDRLLRWGLLVGIPVAILVAWRYPDMGLGSDAEARPGDP